MTRSERLAAIRARAEKAAAREWGMDEEPSRFEMDAREDIPWLLEEVERLEAELLTRPHGCTADPVTLLCPGPACPKHHCGQEGVCSCWMAAVRGERVP